MQPTATTGPARGLATLVGAGAIVMWATLAVLTTQTGAVPAFQLLAITFMFGAALAGAKWLARRENPLAYLRQPWQVWALGVGGLFGYHALYFQALRLAPPVEASLINYMWPLLVVLFSGLLPGERLGWRPIAGAALGLAGVALLLNRGDGLGFEARYVPGYVAALACAVTWAGYSVLSRRFGQVPTDTVGGFCLVVAMLAMLCHLAFERTVWPQGAQWLAVAALGIGPVGLAFFAWDIGVKRGNIRLLGVLSYGAPLMSTLLLVAFGRAEATAALAGACGLIMAGALLASLKT